MIFLTKLKYEARIGIYCIHAWSLQEEVGKSKSSSHDNIKSLGWEEEKRTVHMIT
jgi:hypothetical protein